MTDQQPFEQQLQDAYQQSKQQHRMPNKLKKHILQHVAVKESLPVLRWYRQAHMLCACVCLMVLGYFMLQPVVIPSYQIIISYNDQAIQTESHSVSTRSVPAVLAPFSSDLNVQRFQLMLAAQQHIEQFHAEQGNLKKVQDHWQIVTCNDMLVNIDQALLTQLSTIDLPIKLGVMEQPVEFVRGDLGELLAIRPINSTELCPASYFAP